MPISIQTYAEPLVPAVRAFNERIAASDGAFPFPESPIPGWLAPNSTDHSLDASVYQEMFAATDETGAVRGGYVLKHQLFTVAGDIRSIGFYRSPVSEGIADRRYATVGAMLLRDALRRQPLLFALGLGDREGPLPRMLQAMRWNIAEVPFYFRIERGRTFRELRAVRTSTLRRAVFDVAALTGAGAIASRFLHRPIPHLPAGWTIVGSLPPAAEADALFQSVAPAFSFCAVRTRAVLDRLYETPSPCRQGLSVFDNHGALAGWAIVLSTPMHDDKYFGNLRVGSIIDVLARNGAEWSVIAAATAYLHDSRADLIISNQSHRRWRDALQHCGFRQGPSNFLFAASPGLWTMLGGEAALDRVHLLRADGDGPIHL